MQNYYNPQYNPMMNGGQAYGMAKPQASNSQPLTVDIVNTLRQEGAEMNMKVDQRDIWRAICTHKDPTTGQNTLVQNPDGSYTCSICGETFNFFEGTVEEIEEAVKKLIDMFQTCKTIYLDAPVNMTEQYYQQICLLRKFPALWKHAVNNFSKYENYGNNPLNPISSNYGGFNALNNLLTNPYYMQQPMMYGQPQQAPMGYQQPMMQQPVDTTGNPLAYGGVPAAPMAPMPGAMPAAQNNNVAAAPAPATQNGEVQQQKVYNV